MESLSQKEINERFARVQKEVELRWNLLSSNHTFSSYCPDWTQEEIDAEFFHLDSARIAFKDDPLFKPYQTLIENKQYRARGCITFEHSATDPTYNSTCISFGKRRFLALEGPLQEHVSNFYTLLERWNVAYLVCLTNAFESDGTPKCHPYWEGHLLEKNQDSYLRLPNTKKEIPYIYWPKWVDGKGTCPNELSAAIKQACNRLKEGEIMAVHCSAGVGRTGTFVAAACLYDQIEEQKKEGRPLDEISLNIPKLFFYLNLHRPEFVAHSCQYQTLYQTVDALLK